MWYYLDNSENAPSSAEAVVASWEESSSTGAPSALLSSMPTPVAQYYADRLTDTCPVFPSGMMYARSTATLGAEALTSLQEGFPARTSASLARATASMVSAADCGPKWHGSSARLNLHSCSWRTAQCSLLGGFTEYGQTWPRWGMMEDMELWALPTPAALMAEIASGYSPTTSNWPTPTCADAYTDRLKSSQQQEGSMHSVNLSQAVNMQWRTPTVCCLNADRAKDPEAYLRKKVEAGQTITLSDQVRNQSTELARPTPCAEGRGGAQTPGSHLSLEKAVAGWSKDGTREAVTERRCGPRPTPLANSGTGSGVRGEGGLNLQTAVSEEKVWPWATPQCQDERHSGANVNAREEQGRQLQLAHQVGAVGVLNPSWEECLMCWPVGWTQAEPLPVLNWPWRDFRGVVAFRGQPQHAWEPPRTVPKLKDRNNRVKAVGNGQDPSALVLAVKTLLSMNVPQLRRAA